MSTNYDVIVVGARCAGSPTTMLLARKGYRVLAVDRATFPSDTISTHVIHPMGIAALAEWGLLERLKATGCPPIHTYVFDFGPAVVTGAPGTQASPVGYCARRTVLDKLLVDAAVEAGAEVREGVAVTDVIKENGRVAGIVGETHDGRRLSATARVVVGADGRRSRIAELVKPEAYHERPPILAAYYAYWSGLPMDGRFETYARTNRGAAAAPTNDGLTLVIAGWPTAEMEANVNDIEGNYMRVFDQVPAFRDRLAKAKRETRFSGAAVPNFFHKPFGPGWALVGDAGYNKDFITAQGINDAFRDAGLLSTALDESLSGARSFDEAMAHYQRTRDAQVLPMYEMTCEIATLAAPPAEMQQLIGAMQGNQAAMDDFCRMNAGTISPADFMAPDNVARIMAGAARPA